MPVDGSFRRAGPDQYLRDSTAGDESFHANGQPLEWHYFHFGNHGFASTESDGYQPYLADLVWPLVTEFLGRELTGPAL